MCRWEPLDDRPPRPRPPRRPHPPRDNDVSGFHQKIAVAGKVLTIERGSELKRRWIDPAAFPALKEAALAEHRTNKRRLRVSCR
jgi:hypothetical protein